jgi:hypothetical protein
MYEVGQERRMRFMRPTVKSHDSFSKTYETFYQCMLKATGCVMGQNLNLVKFYWETVLKGGCEVLDM